MLDVGATVLDDGFSSKTLVPVSVHQIGPSSRGVEDAILFVHGFPGSRSMPTTSFVRSKSLPLLTGPRAARRVPWFDERIHFAIDYAALGLMRTDGVAEDWTQPGGLSGSAVWAVNGGVEVDGWSPSRSKIVGVLSDFNQDDQVLVAVRVEVVREFLLTTLRQTFAHEKWMRRGCPVGDEWVDWFLAVREFPVFPNK